MKKKTPKKMGTPSRLTTKKITPLIQITPKKIKALAKIGATTQDISEIYGISIECFRNFLKRNPDLLRSLREDKAKADGQVEASLYMRALGFSHPEVKVFYNAVLDKVTEHTIEKYYPPSDVACIFWLKNRQPEKWRELQEFAGKFENEHSGTIAIEVEDVTDDVKRRAESNFRIVQRYGALGSGVSTN